ncbi:HlyD family secretion protein [Edaphovirga cremea]|uniref:HlyD family secretion protein n=1 Tax=Edaphovirga cremea TaxID=2267246 RepID=UPI000DEED332|nr:HlyD family secretion protein [Edaphovirga cremea]
MFRKEVYDVKGKNWSGHALLIRGIPAWLVSFIIGLLLCIFILFITFGSYTRRMIVSGEVTSHPRGIIIYSGVQGFASEIIASPHGFVKKGDELMRIDVSKSTRHGSYNLGQRNDLESQIEKVNSIISGLKKNKEVTLNTLKVELEQYISALELSSKILSRAEEGGMIMKRNYDDYKNYHLRRLITKDQLSSQATTYFQQQNSISDLMSIKGNYEIQISRINSEIKTQSSDFDNKIYQFEMQELELKRDVSKNDVDGEFVVRAASDGFVDSISVTEGQMVREGDSLFQLKPGKVDSFYVIFWVTNEALPYIKTGDIVNIRYDAYPHQKYGQFSSRIVSISSTPASPQEMQTYRGAPSIAANPSTPYYKVLVRPLKQHIKIKLKTYNFENGMKAEGTLFLEDRKIYQWIFSPFYEMHISAKGPLNE